MLSYSGNGMNDSAEKHVLQTHGTGGVYQQAVGDSFNRNSVIECGGGNLIQQDVICSNWKSQ